MDYELKEIEKNEVTVTHFDFAGSPMWLIRSQHPDHDVAFSGTITYHKGYLSINGDFGNWTFFFGSNDFPFAVFNGELNIGYLSSKVVSIDTVSGSKSSIDEEKLAVAIQNNLKQQMDDDNSFESDYDDEYSEKRDEYVDEVLDELTDLFGNIDFDDENDLFRKIQTALSDTRPYVPLRMFSGYSFPSSDDYELIDAIIADAKEPDGRLIASIMMIKDAVVKVSKVSEDKGENDG